MKTSNLKNFLANPGQYQELNLWGNEIGDEGAKLLAEALKANNSLSFLDLRDNYIGIEGAIALAEALKENTTLTSLNLKLNKEIETSGIQALAEARILTGYIDIIMEIESIEDGGDTVFNSMEHQTREEIEELFNEAEDRLTQIELDYGVILYQRTAPTKGAHSVLDVPACGESYDWRIICIQSLYKNALI